MGNNERDKNKEKNFKEGDEEEEEGGGGSAVSNNSKEDKAKKEENLSSHAKRIKRLNTQP